MLLYLLLTLPPLLFGFYAQSKVKSNFSKYREVPTARGVTGAEVARALLDSQGLHHVAVEETGGFLSDHYDPSKKVLRLSRDVYRGKSVAAAGIAAHEMGHALQDAENYAPLTMRSSMVPSVTVGSWVGPLLLIVGMFIHPGVALIGLMFFAATVLFSIVTLPVEFDASRRAKKLLVSQGILAQQELKGVNQVLDAAALTYVAVALQAISTLLYYAFVLFGDD
ncbi:MAG: zinc metallopeptidase [Ardenticatenaceae bacterium]